MPRRKHGLNLKKYLPMLQKRMPAMLTILGVLIVLASIITVVVIDLPMIGGERVTFTDPTGDRLAGTYYPGDTEEGILLLAGFGSDQVTMTSIASEYVRAGWHVFTFDFSGHGRSPGRITFDNASTDRLALQTLSALEAFRQASGLETSGIFIAGHSMGARVGLQAATLSSEKVAGLFLLGTSVNLSANTQSDFFTGTEDGGLAWVQGLGQDNPATDIFLLSGAWDDVLPADNAMLLFEKLNGEPCNPMVTGGSITTCQPSFSSVSSRVRYLGIYPNLFHNYEPFSPRLISFMLGAEAVGRASLRIWCWVLGFLGLLLAVHMGARWAAQGVKAAPKKQEIQLKDMNRFLRGKSLLWFAALIPALILTSIIFFVPLGKPLVNLIYVGFIGGYGILLAVLYARGRMPGVKGKLQIFGKAGKVAWKPLTGALGIAMGMLVLTALYARTGWFFVFPLNLRLLWLVVFVPFTALGFWIGLKEGRLLEEAGSPKEAGTTLSIINLLPFLLYVLLMATLGSTSGLLAGAQGLLILWLVLLTGRLIQTVGKRPWLTAFCMAILLYWLVLPQGPLF